MGTPPEAIRIARALVARAIADLTALRALAEHAAGVDEIAGFHAQQAVEKSLKAVLVYVGVEAPRTHDLVFLVDLALQAGVTLPEALESVADLYPYAVEFRYAEAPPESALPVHDMVAMAETAVAWAGRVIDGAGSTST